MSAIAFIGAGRLGSSLAVALAQQGLRVDRIASRSEDSARLLAGRLPDCRAVDLQTAAEADLVFLTVPDDHIGPLADHLHWRPGQAVIHCSGATEVVVLDAAARAGALTGGFHPLQIFSDPEQAVGLLAGSAVAIEGPPVLEAELRRLAEQLQMRVLSLPPGARALYHGSASFAASFLLSLLHEAASLWRQFGIDEDQALQALLPLARGTLAAAASKGLAGALSGPISRADLGVVQGHLQALDNLAPPHAALYRSLATLQLDLARRSGRLQAHQLDALAQLLDLPVPPQPAQPATGG